MRLSRILHTDGQPVLPTSFTAETPPEPFKIAPLDALSHLALSNTIGPSKELEGNCPHLLTPKCVPASLIITAFILLVQVDMIVLLRILMKSKKTGVGEMGISSPLIHLTMSGLATQSCN